MRQRILLGLLLLLAVCGPSSGQIAGTGVTPTFEVSPMQGNAVVTAVQSTVTAVESVLQSAYMLLDLTPIDDVAISSDLLAQMALVSELAFEGEALLKDAQGAAVDFEVLFSVEVLPSTPSELAQRYYETTQALYQARRYAVRTQSLISHISGAAAHMSRIIELAGILLGNMQGQQLQLHLQAQANAVLATQALQAAATQRVQAMEGAQRNIMVLGWNKMQAERWDGWPTSVEGVQ